MDQTEWPVEDAPSYERQAQDHVFQGRIDAAADCYEKALRIRLKSGDKPSQLVHAAEVLARASNHACKDASVPKAGERQLQRTLGLLYDVRDSGCAGAVLLSCINLTLANLAALHTRAGRHTTALRYLREAEALGAPPAEAAATHLSLCALLSQLGRHKEAEHHAAEAVALGEADILELSSHRSEGVTPALLREKASALAVAYNNRAVQREYLGGEDCLALYEKAVVLAEGHMEKENPLLIRLQESHRNALQISVGRKSHRRPSSAVNVRSAPRRDAEVKRPVSAVESRRASSASSRAKPNLDQELLRLLRPEEQHVLAARHKAREGADDNPEVPLSAPTLPRHMRVALEQQREGARCHQAVGTWVEDGHGRDCAGISGTSGTSDMSSRRRETGDPRLQHALHFAGCEAARRIQQAYRKHLWFLKVRREARQARKKAADAQRPTPETPSIESIQPRPRLQSLHEVSRDSLPQRVSNFRAVSTETQSEKIEKDEILKHSLHHSAPSDALPRPRAMELTNGLPQRTLPSLGSNPGSLALGSCTKVAEMQPKEIQDKAGSKLLERQQAAATIQASWARFRQLKRQNMAMWMQAMVRYRLQRQEFLEQVHATKQIQRKWRIHSANQRAHQHVKDQADLAVQQEPEEEEMPATQTLEHQEEKRNEVNEACQVQEELPVQQEPEEQEMPATQTLDALEEEKQEKHDVNEACQVQEELPVRHEPEEQEMPATQTLDAQEEEKQQKHEANEACQVQEELPVQQEPEEQEMPATQTLEHQEEKRNEVNEACQVQEGLPVQLEPEEQEMPATQTLDALEEEKREKHDVNEACQVQEELSVRHEPEEQEMPATQTLDAQEEEKQQKHEANEACQVQEELPVQQEPEEQEMPATQTLDAQEEEKQEKHDVNEACQVQEELPVRHEPEEQEMPATQTLDAQEEEKQQKHEVNEACQVQEELPVQQEPEEQEMPLDAPEEKKKEKHEVNEACEGQEGIPVQQGPEEQEVPTLELQQEQQNEGCQVQEELAGEQDPGEELESAESEHQKQHGQRQQQAAAIIQASWTRARRRNMLSMAVWMQAMLRCRLQQQLFLQHCHAPRTLQKAAVSVADDEGVEVDCISNDSRDTTASEEESKVFKPKCDAWACAQCGLVNEVSPDICVLCEGPKPLRRSSLAQRARQRRAR